MQAFLEYVVKGLVQHPDAVTITPVDRSGATVYELRLAAQDVGKLINLPVLKHHQSAGVTLALKNLSHGLVNFHFQTKEKLLAHGDRCEAQIAADRAADAPVALACGPRCWRRANAA